MNAPQRLHRRRTRGSGSKTLRIRLERYVLYTGYVIALVMPGGFLLLPVIAWWHRRHRVVAEVPPRNPDPAKVAARWRRLQSALSARRGRRAGR